MSNVREIQGINVELPPVGYITDYRTGKLTHVGVWSNYKSRKSLAHWEPDPRWKKYEEWRKDELTRQKRDSSYIHSDLKKFIQDCWLYRLGGFWFMNGGEPEYLTGAHWFYLSCYELDTGLPKYKELDRDYFYLWSWVLKTEWCYGLVELTKRRAGKSYRAGCIALESSSRSLNFNVGIQSKTDDDAAKFFKKTITTPYRKLPYFFKPKTNLPQSGKMSVRELKFETGSVQSELELGSVIDYGSSGESYYDGQKLKLYIRDEAGKVVTANINDGFDVVQFCLKDDEGRIIGKCIHTTTVEKERDKKGGRKEENTCDRNFLKMWKESNQNELIDGQTASGMIRFFAPADQMRHIDKFGRADAETAYNEIMRERERIKDNPRKLANLKRKEPLTEKEAFQSDGDTAVFNPEILNSRLDELKWVKPQYQTGNFQWKDGIRDGEVEFSPNPNGRFKVMYLPEKGQANRVVKYGGIFQPAGKESFSAGIDTYDHRQNSQGSRAHGLSDGALVIMKKFHPLHESRVDGGPCCIYKARPAPEVFYEDCLMALRYYGVPALVENNKPGLLNYFEDRGHYDFLVWIPGKNTPGIYAGTKSNSFIAELTDQFITDNINTVYYEELLEDWLGFSPDDTNDYDLAMAFGYALMMLKSVFIKEAKQTEEVGIEDVLSFW